MALHSFNYNDGLKKTITFIELFTYTIAVIIISLGILKSIINYIKEYNTPNKDFYDTRLILGQTISLSLTFILSIEILKLIYIKSYKQLVIIISVVLLKLVISFYLEYEFKTTKEFKNESHGDWNP